MTHTDAKIDPLLEAQFSAGRLYAAISSRPGQCGRADGYVLEGKELEVCSVVLMLADWSRRSCTVLPQKDQNRQTEARPCLISRLAEHSKALDT